MNKCIVAIVVLILNVHFCSAELFSDVSLYSEEEIFLGGQVPSDHFYNDFSTELRSGGGSPDNYDDEEMDDTTDLLSPVGDGLLVLVFLIFAYGLLKQIRKRRMQNHTFPLTDIQI